MGTGKYIVLFIVLLGLFLMYLGETKQVINILSTDSELNRVCYGCTLKALEPSLIKEATDFYDGQHYSESFLEGEKSYLLGRLKDNLTLTCESVKYYDAALSEQKDNLLILKILFLLSFDCGYDGRPYLERLKNSNPWEYDLLLNLYHGKVEVKKYPVEIRKNINVPTDANVIILGLSKIDLLGEKVVGTQTDRVTRDWFSTNIDGKLGRKKNFLDYHEGKLLNRIQNYSSKIHVMPFNGILAVYNGEEWLTADENGEFRFVISEDKIEYPTNKCFRNVCLIIDTHGISSIVYQSIESNADLIIGCGDSIGKMQAAYYLAQNGTDVYFPADRFISEVLGYEGEGVLLGTAPVKEGRIGGQQIEVNISELIVVEDAANYRGGLHYYDTPMRYFKELEKYRDLNIDYFKIDKVGESWKVTERARKLDSHVIAVRVMTEEEYIAISKWLREDLRNRAVLFHSSLYPSGQRLFDEFENQTSFGDPRPLFINKIK